MDEHALKQLNYAGSCIERERKWRKRLSMRAREIVNRQAEQIRNLRAALMARMREDE